MDENIFTQELAVYDRKLREAEERNTQLERELQRLQNEVIHDRETSIYTPAYFHTRLTEEIIRSERYRHFLSLILIHLELSGTHSTEQLTREIRRIGQELSSGLNRRTDIIALFRKRQMIIMLPETDPRGVITLLSRYQATFHDNGRRLNYSVLTYPNDASNIEMVLTRLQELSEDLFRSGSSLRADASEPSNPLPPPLQSLH